MTHVAALLAYDVRVRGVVQGVGFRPFVYRLAVAHALSGWVWNDQAGVGIHLEGDQPSLDAFLHSLRTMSPPAASIDAVDVRAVAPSGCSGFVIRSSSTAGHPATRVSPDLPVCEDCLDELFDPSSRRYHYPFVNCVNCGPRYSILLALPYDRTNTTMRAWPLDDACAAEYGNPRDRRFHAQPVACPACGPHYFLRDAADGAAAAAAAELLRSGAVVAVKGLGGYHLACDARNPEAVTALRERKFRKEKPFALMVRDVEAARGLVHLTDEAESLLVSPARPIVLARARVALPGVAPANDDLGVMLAYTPMHHLLFACGAPEVLVMTSANRSSEPICFRDEDAFERLGGIADAFLVGERPIARRVEDSIARHGAFGPVILRRSRGYAPAAVASIPSARPILATGADLKNSITLVVRGQAIVSQHLGDLDQFEAFQSFRETIVDLTSMYEVTPGELVVACDAHPEYASSRHAREFAETYPVQHHRAHIASVLAERAEWEKNVVGVSFDGTGYGDDGTIWGGEFFAGSVAEGLARVAHLRPAALPGGDGAARHPVQAAAGFLAQIDDLPDLESAQFHFPVRYRQSLEMARKGLRTFSTTSMGRLFDTAAALLGFTREITFEGQAAMWVEHLARSGRAAEPYEFPFENGQLDFRPLLLALASARRRGEDACHCARAFQCGVAHGLCRAAQVLCETHGTDTIVLSGGVFQNELLLEDVKDYLTATPVQVWTNRVVPPNDGGISLGQAALAAFHGEVPRA